MTEEARRRGDKNRSKATIGVPKDYEVKATNSFKDHPENAKRAGEIAGTSKKIRKIVENEMLEAIREGLVKKDSHSVPYFQRYVEKFLKSAIDEPDGVCSRMLASGLFNEKLLSKLDSESMRAMEKEREFIVYRLRQTLFDKQKEVFDDDVSKSAICICSRRAGKTELNARRLIKACLTPNSPCLYLNRTFSNAIDQLWNVLMKVCDSIDFQPSKADKREGLVTFANGSSIKFEGVSDISAIDNLRGFKFRLTIVDEVGHLGKNTQYLIDQVLQPATVDFKDSQLFFTGTPPRTKNYATKLWLSNSMKKYTWTLFDNPFIEGDVQSFIENVCKERGITIDDPFIQREYFGVVGAYDKDAVVFHGMKTYDELPKDFNLSKVFIGVDFGFVDYNAIVSILVDNLHQRAYVYRSSKFNKAGMEAIVEAIIKAYEDAQEQLISRGLDDKGNIRIVTDTNVPALVYDLSKKHHLPVERAYKYDKSGSISELAAALRTNVFVSSELKDIKDEAESTVWKRDENDNLVPEIDDDVYHPDAMDALRYAYRNFSDNWTKKKEVETINELPKDYGTNLKEAIVHSTLPPQFQKQSGTVKTGSFSV